MSESNNFVVSNTTLEAEWVKNKVFTWLWYCNNCQDCHSIEHTTELYPYCRQCGAKMKNPQLITVEYDWD